MIFSHTRHNPVRQRMAVFSPRQFLCLLIQLYRFIISPAKTFLFGPGSGCRFTPSCSQYAMEAFQAHGAMGGGVLAIKRICRCHPFGECGHDPVPGQFELWPRMKRRPNPR